MKILSIIIAASIALTSSSFAAKKGGEGKGRKGHKNHPKIGLVLKQYDANGNKTLDSDELEKLKADYAKLAPLVGLDKNGNGTLESEEIAAITDKASKRGGKAKKAGKAKKEGKARKAGKAKKEGQAAKAGKPAGKGKKKKNQ